MTEHLYPQLHGYGHAKGVPDSAPKLLSYEQQFVAHFVVQSVEGRKRILELAQKDPRTSGPLIQVYRYLLTA